MPQTPNPLFTQEEVERIVHARLVEQQNLDQAAIWKTQVNNAVELIGKHIGDQGAHPRLLEIMTRATLATERMERLYHAAVPDNLAEYLPKLLEAQKTKTIEDLARKRQIDELRNWLIAGVPLIGLVFTLIQVILHHFGVL
jgi:hypothetical protein